MSTRSTSPRLDDPFRERELQRYGNAIPSREFILQVLREQGVPLGEERLAQLLDIAPEEGEIFARRLQAMQRDGQLIRNRKDAICIADKLDLIKGRVQGHSDGYGFLVAESGGQDLFLGPKQMHKVLHGDIVMAREVGVDRRGRREGTIVEVLEHVNRRLVGRLYAEHGVLFVVAEDKRISQDILVAPGEDQGAKAGQVVTVEILSQPQKHSEPIARVVEILGSYADPGVEIEIALRKHQLPYEFPPQVIEAAARLPREVLKKDLKAREDLRALPLVTIDGETARDFDDAVYCEPKGRGFRLIVAIADVSYYVLDGGALDVEARERGNSVYFPRRVIPMLPEALSNGLCSLNPGIDRLCMACEMDIGAAGQIKDYRFFPAVMHSQARLTYTQVAAQLRDTAETKSPEHAALLPHLRNLQRVFAALLKARGKRGAIDFESAETEMQFDDQGKIVRIVPIQRNEAHRLIEECMLAANVCASDFLQKHKHHTLYRVHEGPTPEKLAALREFFGEFGLNLGGGDAPKAGDYAVLLEIIKQRPDAQLLQTVMLRSLQQAVYTPENLGHFGLAYESYTHFTSPIRRYPDLLVHRAIKAVLAGTTYAPGNWKDLGVHCSQTERRADDATRDVVAWLKCYYMQDRVGESFAGTVSAATSFGLFVALDEVYVEGLLHISELGNDYFHYDPARHQLLGERTGQRFRLGERLQVRVARVDLETSKIDFVLGDVPEAAEPRKKKARKN